MTICNGTDGTNGSDGATGATGATGAAGPAMLVSMTDEPAGAHCGVAGGTRIDIGWDNGPGSDAGDNKLEAEEIIQTRYLCSNGTGVSEGSSNNPVELTPWSTRPSSVAAGGTSYYWFAAPQNDTYQIALSRTDSDLRWTLYSDSNFNTQVGSTCDQQSGTEGDETCTVANLTAGTYYLKVEERSNIPDLFDALVSDNLLVAAGSDGELYQVNPSDGSLTLLSNPALGTLSALAYAPGSNTLYAATADSNPSCPDCVYAVDPVSGSTEMVGNAPSYVSIPAMAARPWDDQLYGVDDTECTTLGSLDPETGEWTMVQDTSVFPVCTGTGYGMTFDNTGLWLMADYGAQTNQVWEMAQGSWEVSQTGDLQLGTYTFGRGYHGTPTTVAAMATLPATGTVYAVTDSGELATLDPAGGNLGVGNDSFIFNFLATPTPALTSLVTLSRQTVYGPVRDFAAAYQTAGTDMFTWRDYPLAQEMIVYYSSDPNTPIDVTNPSTYAGTVVLSAGQGSGAYASSLPNSTVLYCVIVPVIHGVHGPPSVEVQDSAG